jgi:hypothetical protein
MPIRLSDIDIKTKLPRIADALPLFVVKSPSFEDRELAIEQLRTTLDLGRLQRVDVKESICFVGERGGIQYYRPSGGLWATNHAANGAFEDERRPWKVVAEKSREDPESPDLKLDPVEQRGLSEHATALLRKAELMPEQAYFAGVELEQVAQLDEKGSEVARFAGEATVKFLYRAQEIQCDGPGAKTYAFANPGTGGPQFTGFFHSWREIEDAREIRALGAEGALERGVSRDRELAVYQEKGFRFRLTSVELVYHTMPPFCYQEYVYPALYVIGSAISPEAPLESFEFTRYYNAADPASYIKTGLCALYLNCRP